MGNSALEALSDITEDGNQWKRNSFDANALDVLSSDQGFWDGRSPSTSTPRLFVAATASSNQDGIVNWHRDRTAADRFGGAATCEATDVEEPAEQRRGWVTIGGKTFDTSERPSQVVLQHGSDDWQRPGVRPSSQVSWCPISACPEIRRRGTLLTEARLMELRPHLPVATRLTTCWQLIYSPAVHGVSLRTFYRQCHSWPGESLIFVEDTEGFVFGCFASHTWQTAMRHKHFGDAACFVFSFGSPQENRPLDVHPWAGGEQYFMYADLKGFAMGGGIRPALYLRHDFLTGASCASETFGTPAPLASREEFVVRRLECWTFDHTSASVAALGLPLTKNQWEGLGVRPPEKVGSSGSPEDSPRDLGSSYVLGSSRRTDVRESAQDMLRFRFG